MGISDDTKNPCQLKVIRCELPPGEDLPEHEANTEESQVRMQGKRYSRWQCEHLDPITPEGRLQTSVLRANTFSFLHRLL